jgi:hypothetical protein
MEEGEGERVMLPMIRGSLAAGRIKVGSPLRCATSTPHLQSVLPHSRITNILDALCPSWDGY